MGTKKLGRYFRDDSLNPPENGHKIKRYEVHFRHIFTTSYPYEEIPPPTTTALSLPISKLSHVTHDKEAHAIKTSRSDLYIFKSRKKFGKKYSWDGSSMGETYKSTRNHHEPPTDKTEYMKVSSNEKVFPGSLSWWGLSLREWELPDNPEMLIKRQSDYNIPGYLKLPPKSSYGNNEFSGKLSDLLECYKKSREVSDAYLVIGGTLRYKREICYVIIICTQGDLEEDLREFPPLNQHSSDGVLNLNGLVDDEGKFINPSANPCFKLNHIRTDVSWESLAFAFYFRSDQQVLECNWDVIKVQEISHDQYCTSTKPTAVKGEKWKCPNYLL